jgi:phage recombination protein Bet
MATELIQFDAKQENILKATVAKNTTNEQFGLFLQVCRYTGLNPFAKQIYAVVRGNQMTIQTGIDGFRVLAERSGRYAGQIGPEWCDDSGVWKDVWLSDKPPVAARVGVLRRDFDQPIWGVARYASYEQPSNNLWKKMPEVMLAKCAESLALRRAFPSELSGIYTKEEMDQADESPLPTPTPAPATRVVESAPISEEEKAKRKQLNVLFDLAKEKGLFQDKVGMATFAAEVLEMDVAPDQLLALTEDELTRVEYAIYGSEA